MCSILYVSYLNKAIKIINALTHENNTYSAIKQGLLLPTKKKTTPNLLSILKSKEVGADITSGF